MSVEMWTCHWWPVDVSRNVKLPFLTTICLLYIYIYICIVVDVAIKLICCSKDLGGYIWLWVSMTTLNSEEITLFSVRSTGGYIIRFTWCHTDISLYLPISWLFQMVSHWPHWKVKSSLWALRVSNGGGGIIISFPYIFLLVDCFEWALIDCIEKQRVHSELWQFQMGGGGITASFPDIFLLVDCFKWALIDCIQKWRVYSELWQFQMGG